MRAHENPFRISRVESLGFRGWPASAAVAELRALDHRAAIVGREGSGKSTLLREIAGELLQDGMRSRVVRFDDHLTLASALFDRETVWLVDGAECIPLPLRAALVGGVRRIVITTHDRTAGLPVLLCCETTVILLRQLAADLGEPLQPAEADAVFRGAGGNLRLAFRSLYDVASAQDFVGAFRAR